MSMSRGETSEAERGPGWGSRVLMLGGGLLGAMALMAITSVLPKIGTAPAHGPGDGLLIKQLVGIVSLAMVVGAPLSGLLVDRLGLRPVLVASGLLYALAGTAGLYLNGLPLLLASRLFVGVAAAAIQIISITLINTRLSTDDRAKWIGWHMATAMIGTIVVHPLAGFLGEFSWRWPFALYAVGLLVVPVALLDPAIGKTPPAEEPRTQTVAPRGGPGWLGWFPFHYMLLALFIGGITYVPMIYVPFLLRQHGLESSTLISLVLTAGRSRRCSTAARAGRSRRMAPLLSASP